MNKQRYLAELQRLLVFMTETDRAEVIRRCSELFDKAGPGGEAELLVAIGSPTKAAISLSKGYVPGRIPEIFPDVGSIPQTPAAAAEPQEQQDPLAEIPSFDLPAYAQDDEQDDAQRSPGSDESFRIPDLPETARTPEEPEKPASRRIMPLGIGIPLFIIIMAAIGIPLAAVCVCAAAAFLVPGAVIIFAAWLVAVGGFWCLSFIPDAVLLFGAAFIVLAIGILILFGGLWLGVKLIALYIRGVRWLANAFFRRRSTVHE